jgi:hypothetical protein
MVCRLLNRWIYKVEQLYVQNVLSFSPRGPCLHLQLSLQQSLSPGKKPFSFVIDLQKALVFRPTSTFSLVVARLTAHPNLSVLETLEEGENVCQGQTL